MELNRNTGIVLLALVVLASGCTSGETETGPASTQAVEVMNYSAVPSTVIDSQPVNLRMRLKNLGEKQAEQVKVKIFGPAFGNPDEQEWKIRGVTPAEGKTNQIMDFGTLRTADEEAGVPAPTREGTITLTPPDQADDVKIPYDFKARVAYEYQNRGVTEISMMGDRRFRDSNVQRSQPTVENTDGPIHMDIRTSTPIVFYGEGQTTSDNLCVIVRNEGRGTPYLGETTPTPEETFMNKVSLTISSPGGIGFKPVGGEAGDNDTTVKADLVGNRKMKCFEFTNLQEEFSTTDIEKTIPITLKADYNYFTETQTSVTVKGRQG